MRHLLIAGIVLAPGCAMADMRPWEGLYQGTIGTAKVLVLLSHEDGLGEDSRYSYAARPYDLGLTLEKDGTELSFVESRKLGAGKDDLRGKGKALITGRWTLQVSGQSINGIWKDATGQKSLPIALALVNKPQPDKQGFAMVRSYHQQWARDISFAKTTQRKTFGAVQMTMVKDSVFDLAYPRLTAHPDPARLVQVNALLEIEHRRAVAESRQCQEYRPRQEPDAIKAGKPPKADNLFTVSYASPNLLSIVESGSVHCGGAHPNNYSRSTNFDLTSADRLFKADGDEADENVLSTHYLGRVLDIGSPAKLEAFNRFWWDRWMAGASKPRSDDTDCDDGFMNNQPLAERTAEFHFIAKGLAITRTDYPHAMSVCLGQSYNPMVVSWKDLKPWLKPGQRLLVDEIR